MHPAAHRLREKLANGEPVLGTFLVEFTGPAVVSALADAGYDFATIDCEHGNQDPRQVESMVEAGYQEGLAVFVRPPDPSRGLITRVLDAGAAGILMPAIQSLDQVQQVVRATKYWPVGKRGVHLFRGHTRHRPAAPDAATFMAEANHDLFTMIQIELEAALQIVDQIAATPGVDVLYVGPGDLSVDLGVPGQWQSPVVQEAITQVAAACRKHGKVMACHADRVEDMPRLRDLGVGVFGYYCDIGLFKSAAAGIAQQFRSALGSAPR